MLHLAPVHVALGQGAEAEPLGELEGGEVLWMSPLPTAFAFGQNHLKGSGEGSRGSKSSLKGGGKFLG